MRQTTVGSPSQQVRVVLRALALLQLAKGVSAPRIAGVIPLTAQAIRNVGRRYQQGGLDRALYEKPRPGAAEVLDDRPITTVWAKTILHKNGFWQLFRRSGT